jgi:hypothetical protein
LEIFWSKFERVAEGSSVGEDKRAKPTETTTAPTRARPAQPPDVIEKGWDLVDPTPPPQA